MVGIQKTLTILRLVIENNEWYNYSKTKFYFQLCTSEHVSEGVCCQSPPDGSGVVGVVGTGSIGGTLGSGGYGGSNSGSQVGIGGSGVGNHGSGSGSQVEIVGSGVGVHGSSSATSFIHPVCGVQSDCVPYFQCDNEGYINVAGIGIIDIRTRPAKPTYEEKVSSIIFEEFFF